MLINSLYAKAIDEILFENNYFGNIFKYKKSKKERYNKVIHKNEYKIQREYVKCKSCGCLVKRINQDGICEDCGEYNKNK